MDIEFNYDSNREQRNRNDALVVIAIVVVSKYGALLGERIAIPPHRVSGRSALDNFIFRNCRVMEKDLWFM